MMPDPVSFERRFVAAWWGAVWLAARSANWVAIVLLGVVAFLMVGMAANTGSASSFLGLPQVLWLGVTGSVLASFVFLVLQTLVAALRAAEPSLYQSTYDALVGRHGIYAVFDQRGSGEAVGRYSELLQGARRRIWAFGMTNRHFVRQHLETILATTLAHDVDVVIAFWDPDATITYPKLASSGLRTTLAHQARLEGSDGDPAGAVRDRQEELLSRWERSLSGTARPRGNLRVANVTSAAHFSALIIDDDVFFFPFLAVEDSTNHPTIHCCATYGVGRVLDMHLTNLLTEPEAARIVVRDPVPPASAATTSVS